ncbi:NHL repeat-containing protein [Pelagibacteraceae bacterium]|nr:NHL repeat-containing protein [Pelagibacteraceae bacterium]
MKLPKIKISKKTITINGIKNCYGLAVDKKGNLFFPDFNLGLIYKVSKNFKYIKKLELKSKILKPHSIFFDKKENMYVTCMGLGYKKGKGSILIFSKRGKLLNKVGITEHGNKGLISPVSCYLDENKKKLYISEYGSNKILIYNNNVLESWIGKYDKKKDNKILNNSWKKKKNFLNLNLSSPHTLVFCPDKYFYIADTGNHRILKFNNKWKFSGSIGSNTNHFLNKSKIKKNFSKSLTEEKKNIFFNLPVDIKYRLKHLFVSDCNNNRIVKLNMKGEIVSFIKGFKNPYTFCFFKNFIYVADRGNNRIKILKLKKKT